MKLDPELETALAGDLTPKFLATLDPAGQPNCVPVTTLAPYADDTLVFGEFMMNKTRNNLLHCDKVGVAVVTPTLAAWSVKGTFLGFETAGDAVDLINSKRLFRYNAYTSIRAAGRIRIEAISSKCALGQPCLLWSYLRARLAARWGRSPGPPTFRMPRQVVEKFSRLSAIRGAAYRDADGYPRAFALMACVPAGPDRLVFGDGLSYAFASQLSPGERLAIAVLTRDAIAYQVKGAYVGRNNRLGVVAVDECYSACPPLVGERLGQATASPAAFQR